MDVGGTGVAVVGRQRRLHLPAPDREHARAQRRRNRCPAPAAFADFQLSKTSSDTSASTAAAETAISGEAWNVGAGQPQSVNRLVKLLSGDSVFIPKRPGEPDCTFADIRKIKRDLGWAPEVSFEDGVAKVLQIVRERIPARYGLDPIADIQVLCPMNRGGLGARSEHRWPSFPCPPWRPC